MSDQIKQIAERLQGLRDVLELTPDEVAKSCQLSVSGISSRERLPSAGRISVGLILKLC